MNDTTIDSNIWQIDLFSKNGIYYNYYALTDIFYYNSLKDRTFYKAAGNINKSPYLHLTRLEIPEKLIKDIYVRLNINDKNNVMYGYETIRDFVLINKNIIIKNKYSIIKKQIINDKEEWSVDLNMLFYDKNKNWKNEYTS